MNHSKTTGLLTVLIAINTFIFLLMSLLHFYWGFGGTLLYADVLPTNSSGSKRMEPGLGAALVIAFALLILAFVTMGNSGIWDNRFRRKYFGYGALSIAIVFLLRAIGDFKFIGFFKTITATRFAVNDTWLFSPLCLLIAVISLIIFIWSRQLNDH